MKKTITLIFLTFLLLFHFTAFAHITEQEYNEVKIGMDFSEIEHIFQNIIYYHVRNDKNKNISAFVFKNDGKGFSVFIYEKNTLILKVHSNPDWDDYTTEMEQEELLTTIPLNNFIKNNMGNYHWFAVKMLSFFLSLKEEEDFYTFIYYYTQAWNGKYFNIDSSLNIPDDFGASYIAGLKNSTKKKELVKSDPKIRHFMKEFKNQDPYKFVIANLLIINILDLHPNNIAMFRMMGTTELYDQLKAVFFTLGLPPQSILNNMM